jgi:hypothetical protein
MSHKYKLALSIFVILLGTMMTIPAARVWGGPLYQMDMPTDTAQPQVTTSLVTPIVQNTPVPGGNESQQTLPSPTFTSIFTGFTQNPTAMSTYVMPMGGSGMMGGGMVGSSTVMTGTMGTTGMGMGGCSMMSGSGMGSTGMGAGSSMGGMEMGDDMWMAGIDMSTLRSSAETESSLASTNPWWILGWVVLGLVILAILAGAVLGIVWLVRRSRDIQQVQS